MARKIKIKEQVIAELSAIYFKHFGYDMYPECVLPIFGGRPDYVAIKPILDDPKKSWVSVVECKETLSQAVLDQILRWHIEKDHFEKSSWWQEKSEEDKKATTAIPHFLWVATGNSNTGKWTCTKRYLMEKFRIGWIDFTVSQQKPESWSEEDWLDSYYTKRYRDKHLSDCSSEDYGHIRIGDTIYEYRVPMEAKLQSGSRTSAWKIAEHLSEDMKQAVAGTTGSGTNYMTPFKRTLHRAETVLKASDKPLTMVDILSGVKELGGHHYARDAGFKNSIGGWLVERCGAVKVKEYPPMYEIKDK